MQYFVEITYPPISGVAMQQLDSVGPFATEDDAGDFGDFIWKFTRKLSEPSWTVEVNIQEMQSPDEYLTERGYM